MSKFAVGDKVQIRVTYDFLYNGVTGDVTEVDERVGTYLVSLDVGGDVVAEEACLVEPGTSTGTDTCKVE